MSLFNKKTFLDGGFESLSVHGISLGDVGGFVGDALGGLTGATAAAEAGIEGARLSAESAERTAEKQIDFSKWLWGEQKELAAPYAALGVGAIPEYQAEVEKGMTLDDLYKDPGYEFGLSEGRRAYETSAAAKGMQLSGAAVKGQTRFGQDYASTKYGEAFNRRQSHLDNLYRMISTGQAAASGQAATGGQMGTRVLGAMGTAGAAERGMYQDIGNIKGAQATSGFNTLMDIGNLAASFSGGGSPQATRGFVYGG